MSIAWFDFLTLYYGCSGSGSPACETCGPPGGSPDPGRWMNTDEEQTGIYPNPFNQSAIFIISDETIYDNASFSIYDMMGNQVRRIENINSNEIQIEKGNMKNGIYYYHYMNGENILSSGKFVISE